ncbi:hypothetical protein [Mycoplasma seminis]|uniref:Uncharacterized protein n=1 Tax=Mycoplasma seminis TaxID=512749 RepID=A0ABY9HAZ2_9MOLU|nr:hypothetical protein [Mycoplasma seminis]WLP85772.1 hypothetical protein Q8852_01315 [Mycoplasma seminis]
MEEKLAKLLINLFLKDNSNNNQKFEEWISVKKEQNLSNIDENRTISEKKPWEDVVLFTVLNFKNKENPFINTTLDLYSKLDEDQKKEYLNLTFEEIFADELKNKTEISLENSQDFWKNLNKEKVKIYFNLISPLYINLYGIKDFAHPKDSRPGTDWIYLQYDINKITDENIIDFIMFFYLNKSFKFWLVDQTSREDNHRKQKWQKNENYWDLVINLDSMNNYLEDIQSKSINKFAKEIFLYYVDLNNEFLEKKITLIDEKYETTLVSSDNALFITFVSKTLIPYPEAVYGTSENPFSSFIKYWNIYFKRDTQKIFSIESFTPEQNDEVFSKLKFQKANRNLLFYISHNNSIIISNTNDTKKQISIECKHEVEDESDNYIFQYQINYNFKNHTSLNNCGSTTISHIKHNIDIAFRTDDFNIKFYLADFDDNQENELYILNLEHTGCKNITLDSDKSLMLVEYSENAKSLKRPENINNNSPILLFSNKHLEENDEASHFINNWNYNVYRSFLSLPEWAPEDFCLEFFINENKNPIYLSFLLFLIKSISNTKNGVIQNYENFLTKIFIFKSIIQEVIPRLNNSFQKKYSSGEQLLDYSLNINNNLMKSLKITELFILMCELTPDMLFKNNDNVIKLSKALFLNAGPVYFHIINNFFEDNNQSKYPFEIKSTWNNNDLFVYSDEYEFPFYKKYSQSGLPEDALFDNDRPYSDEQTLYVWIYLWIQSQILNEIYKKQKGIKFFTKISLHKEHKLKGFNKTIKINDFSTIEILYSEENSKILEELLERKLGGNND